MRQFFDKNGNYLGISNKNFTSQKEVSKFKGKKFESSKPKKRRTIMREQSGYFEGDLSKLGDREIFMLADMLKLWASSKITQIAADNFYPIKTFGFNANSGNVFLIDDNYQIVMEADGELDLFISLPYSGEEGFSYEFQGRDRGEFNSEDVEYLESLGVELSGGEDEDFEDEDGLED